MVGDILIDFFTISQYWDVIERVMNAMEDKELFLLHIQKSSHRRHLGKEVLDTKNNLLKCSRLT